MKQVKLTIAPDGTATISVNGVCGPECKEITRPVEEALGIVESSSTTEEMYSEISQVQEVER